MAKGKQRIGEEKLVAKVLTIVKESADSLASCSLPEHTLAASMAGLTQRTTVEISKRMIEADLLWFWPYFRVGEKEQES